MQTNTQNVCPFCGGPGYHVSGCQALYPKASPDIKVPAFDKSSALDAPQVIPPISNAQLKRELETKPENKSVFTRIDADPIFMAKAELEALVAELRQAHGAAIIAQGEAVRRMEVAEHTLRENTSILHEEARIYYDRTTAAEKRLGESQETIYTLKNALLELCEKMEAGISGPEETKRARRLLDAIKANQEKK